MIGTVQKVVEKTRNTLAGKETLTGGALIARMLKAEGVNAVFGIIDGSYFGFYKAVRDLGMKLYGPRHESSGLHMAGMYARLTGKLGVAMASNGPGVANALSGITVENAEGNRVLLVTSARRTGTSYPIRVGTFQSFPQVEVIRSIAKWSNHVPTADRLPELTQRALRACFTGQPGVVHLNVPEDILNTPHAFRGDWEVEPKRYRRIAPLSIDAAQIEEAVEMLLKAKKPFIHAGTGVVHAGAFTELARVAELLHAPVTTSWGGRASVDERQSYAVPLTYMDLVSRVRAEGDLALILGSKVGETDWWGRPPYWRKPTEQLAIQVDLDQSTLGLNKPIDLGLVSDIKTFLAKLADRLEARAEEVDREGRRTWLHGILDERAKLKASLQKHLTKQTDELHSAQIVTACQRAFGDDAIAVLDGGNTVVWGQFFTEVRRPNSLFTTFKLGMLGAGVPQTIAAKAACPDRPVYCLIGDGAMGFQPQELETAARYKLNVTYVVFCDRQWGMVKIGQSIALRPVKTLIKGTIDETESINTDFSEVRFDKLAEALGATGERVSDLTALEAALERAKAHPGPSVIHADVDPVKHMWAPGLKKFKDMHAAPKG